MNDFEKALFVADILFAALSVCFFFPKFRKLLWTRLLCISLVFGVNIFAFWRAKNGA
jgi:hypothetical protein